jgi:hypothetical protein
MATLTGNPYFEFGPRPFREARLRSYIVRQHRAGRALSEILDDPYVARCGSASFCWSVLEHPRTLQALGDNDRERIVRLSRELAGLRTRPQEPSADSSRSRLDGGQTSRRS